MVINLLEVFFLSSYFCFYCLYCDLLLEMKIKNSVLPVFLTWSSFGISMKEFFVSCHHIWMNIKWGKFLLVRLTDNVVFCSLNLHGSQVLLHTNEYLVWSFFYHIFLIEIHRALAKTILYCHINIILTSEIKISHWLHNSIFFFL
jgi:hypothetical protein